MGGSLTGVLRNFINRVGTPSSYTPQLASGASLIVVVTIQIY